MLKKITNWIRSKFHKGYAPPTVQEIQDFLETKYILPINNKNEKIVHRTPAQLREEIYLHFKIYKKTDQLELIPTIHTAFKKCGYRVIYMKDRKISKVIVKKIALVEVKTYE